MDQDELVYIPIKDLKQNPECYQSPADLDLNYEPLEIITKDNVKLSGWFAYVNKKTARDRPTLIFFHGNSGNIGYCLGWMEAIYHELKANLVLVDYRGYGDSQGKPSEAGLMHDARATLDYVVNQLPVDKSRIYLWGASMGGAVAIALAAEEEDKCRKSALDQPRIAGVVLENTFTALWEVVPTVTSIFARISPTFFKYIMRSKWPSRYRIESIKLPILFLESRLDEIVPNYMSQMLNALCDPRQRVLAHRESKPSSAELLLCDDIDRAWYQIDDQSPSPRGGADTSEVVNSTAYASPGKRLPTSKHIFTSLLRYIHSDLTSLLAARPTPSSSVGNDARSRPSSSSSDASSPLPSPRMTFSDIVPESSGRARSATRESDAATLGSTQACTNPALQATASISESDTKSGATDSKDPLDVLCNAVLSTMPEAESVVFVADPCNPAREVCYTPENITSKEDLKQLLQAYRTLKAQSRKSVAASSDLVTQLATKLITAADDASAVSRSAYPALSDHEVLRLLSSLPLTVVKQILTTWTHRMPLPSASHNDALFMEQPRYLQCLGAFLEGDGRALLRLRSGRRMSKVEFVQTQAISLQRRTAANANRYAKLSGKPSGTCQTRE